MALLQPKKGTGPATGKTKPSRAEVLMSATQALAAEQLPDSDTMTAIEGAAPTSEPRPAPETPAPATPGARPAARARGGAAATPAAPSAPATPASEGASHHETGAVRGAKASPRPAVAGVERSADGSLTIRTVRTGAVRPSPFQPKGRPSITAVEAVRAAVQEAGSLDQLVGDTRGRVFAQLDAEAARLAELASDIQQHGMKIPVEVRTTEDGALECLSGHRRLAAAKLAGLETIDVIDRGPVPNAAAAATVLRGNLHRENFTTWQEAVLVTEVQDRRRADGIRDTVRTLGSVMGWSHGKVNMLLRIRQALSPAVIERVGGDPDLTEERLARAAYGDLARLANEADEGRRVALARRLLGVERETPGPAGDRLVCVHRPRRGGGFVLEVNRPVEALDRADARALRDLLDAQMVRVNARLHALGDR